MSYNGIEKYNWVYGADGRIGLHNDLVNDVTWRYEYTKDGSLTSAYGTNDERFDYTYEPSTGKLLTATVSDGTTSKTTTYNYSDHTNGEEANLIESVVLPTATITYDYDGFYRTSYDVEVNGSDILTTDYTFVDGLGENSTTTLVESVTVSGSDWSDTLSYTYDCKGNIETISENGEQKAKYYYDDLNQLIREDNAWLGKTIAYTYDNGGNILSVSEYAYTTASDISSLTATSTNTYTYGDANWKDKLTSYNGNAITYDAIGNPLTYYNGYTFDWQNGRQLASVSSTGLTASYKYDSSGIRTEKTVNGVTTTYTLEGSNIVKETNGTDTIWYYYDAAGTLTGFELNGTSYFYVKNLQGDIIAIADASGNVVVEYAYDSWGKLISTTGSLASTVGVKNPFRYRGYYYDTETSLYYLQSRYYHPCTGRFINADVYVTTARHINDSNMFAYCINNPIIYVDSNGLYYVPYSDLVWPGQIHREVQEHMNRLFGYDIEVVCSTGRIDVVDHANNQCYEIKPRTYSNPEKHANAVRQLDSYLQYEYKHYSRGEYFSPKIGVDKTGTYMFYYWYAGDGIILYDFDKLSTPVKEKQYSYSYSQRKETVYDGEQASNYSLALGIALAATYAFAKSYYSSSHGGGGGFVDVRC